MRGQVLGIDATTGTGQISGEDGQRYAFTTGEWKLPTPPQAGAHVDFQPADGQAHAIYQAPGGGNVLNNAFGQGEKTKMVAGLLAIFLGAFGVHKFYLGRQTPGLIMLAVSIIGFIVTLGLGTLVMSLIALVEGIIYLTQTDQAFHQTYVVEGKDWF